MALRTLAVILAGGRGNRLGVLTAKRTKPAVPFGGKYRIIDFTLSNCVNSLVYNVCVLTQYRPHSLASHLGRGDPWDLKRFDAASRGGLVLLHPHPGGGAGGWYRGTADAVYTNLPFIRSVKPDLVLILSGDHVYRMDYSPMIAEHVLARRGVTVAVMEVPWEDAPRYGVIETSASGEVTRFLEKVPDPPSNLANMGIYVFTTSVLEELLVEDAARQDSQHDFGRDLLPRCVAQNVPFRAFLFREKYWRDVGTIDSYWRANMDLIAPIPEFDLYDEKSRVHTRSAEAPAVKLGRGAQVSESLVSNGCVVDGIVERSVLSPYVEIGAGAVVRDSIVFSGTVIEEGAQVDHAILDKEVIVGAESLVGAGDDFTYNQHYPMIYNSGMAVIGKNAVIPRGTSIGRNVCVFPDVTDPRAFHDREIASGETVEG